MRISQLTLSGFRGFRQEQSIPLAADAIIITGPNGTGKTSLLDAVQWALRGTIPRLEAFALKPGEDYVSNRYSSTPPVVSITLSSDEGEVVVTRRGVGKGMQVTVQLGGESLAGRDAESWLTEAFDPGDSEGKAFLRTFVLQQDELREFLAADPQERYRFLSYLAGVQDIELLDQQLKSELRRLREVMRDVNARVDVDKSRLAASVRSREESLEILSRVTSGESARRSEAVKELSLITGMEIPNESQALGRLVERSRSLLNELRSKMDSLIRREQGAATALQSSVKEVDDDEDAELLLEEIRQSESRLADLQSKTAALESEGEQVAASEDRAHQLASLAIEQLGDRCPVCDQKYDKDHTLAHLMNIVQGESRAGLLRQEADGLRKETAVIRQKLVGLQKALSGAERRNAQRLASQELAQRESQAAQIIRQEMMGVIPDKSVDPNDFVQRLDSALLEAEGLLAARESGVDAKRRLETLDAQTAEQKELVQRGTQESLELSERAKRGEGVMSWLGDRLVDATAEVVRASTPLINELYVRLDVHPLLRRFDFRSERYYQIGRVQPWLFDDVNGVDGNAGHLLSSAQFNVLAVCLFLSVNLGQTWSEFETLLLDDPVQSMDDVNVLGLADTLRGIRRHRQVFVSTHDPRLAGLLWRKLRPLEQGQRTIQVEFFDWTNDGPVVKWTERELDQESMKLELVGSSTLSDLLEMGVDERSGVELD